MRVRKLQITGKSRVDIDFSGVYEGVYDMVDD